MYSSAACLEFEVEEAGPHEGEHGAREVAHQPHEDGEVGDAGAQQHGQHHHQQAQQHRPVLEQPLL